MCWEVRDGLVALDIGNPLVWVANILAAIIIEYRTTLGFFFTLYSLSPKRSQIEIVHMSTSSLFI